MNLSRVALKGVALQYLEGFVTYDCDDEVEYIYL